jgi:hypothetical protein
MLTALKNLTGFSKQYLTTLLAAGVAERAGGDVYQAAARVLLIDALARLRLRGRLRRRQAAKIYEIVA